MFAPKTDEQLIANAPIMIEDEHSILEKQPSDKRLDRGKDGRHHLTEL